MFRKGTTFFASLVSIGVLAASVSLRWNPGPENDLAGYRVYVHAFPFTNSPLIFNVVHPRTNFVWTNAVVGTTYQFSVTAYNTSGLESDPSLPLFYTPTNPITVLVFPSSYMMRSNRFN